MLLGLPVPALSETAPTAAELDWQPWAELPPSLQQQVPSYCGGTYRPLELAGNRDPAGGEQGQADEPINITSRSARYRLDDFMELRGDVRVQQGALRTRSDAANYDQVAGELNLKGDVVSRGQGSSSQAIMPEPVPRG